MTISEQVAELERQVQAAADRAECYHNGVRAGLRGDMMTETDPDGVMDRGWREGDRFRRLVRMDLEGFRAGVLGETFGDGSDPAFVAGYHEGEKVRAEIVRKERAHAPYPPHLAAEIAACKASAMAYANEPAARAFSIADGYYVVHNVPGHDRAVHVRVQNGYVWGYSIFNGTGEYRTLGGRAEEWATMEMRWGEEKALPVGPVRPVQPCPICHRQMFVHPDSELFLDGDGPHTCDEGAKKAAVDTGAEAVPTPRTGGDPPEPEIGMVYTFDKWTAMVCALPCPWPNDMKEVRAPWGGPVIWRRGGAE